MDLSGIHFDNIKYFVRATDRQVTSWDDLPVDIKDTYDKLGIPEAEKQRLLSGVSAQYESETVYHSINEDLERQGVIFMRTPTTRAQGARVSCSATHFSTGGSRLDGDNKFSRAQLGGIGPAWARSSTSPRACTSKIPLQAYFRINTENMGQFERDAGIIADRGSPRTFTSRGLHPRRSTDFGPSLHLGGRRGSS